MATNSKSPNPAPNKDGVTPKPIEDDASPLSIEGLRSKTMNHIAVKVVLFLLIAIFAVGFLFTSFGGNQGLNGGGPVNSTATVATVGERNIDRARLEQVSAQQDAFMAQFGQKVGPLEYFASRQRSLQNLINSVATIQAAQEAGVTVSEAEIDAEIKKQIDEAIKAQREQQGEAAFRRFAESRYGSVEKFREEMQKEANSNRQDLADYLLVQKFEKKIKDENKVTEDDYKKSQTKLNIRQIIVRPKPAPANDATLTQKNKAEAKTKADKLAAQLKKTPTAQNFAAVATKESDDFATKAKGGALGWKLPSELTVSPLIRQGVVNSKDKIVGPLLDENTGDLYIFLVEGRALKLPADYAKNKAKLLKDFETAQDNEAWGRVQAEIAKHAHPEISDPAFQAYKIQSEQLFAAPAAEQDKLRQEAVDKYEQALASSAGMEAAAIRYQLAQLYTELKQPKKAAEVLKVAAEETPNTPQLGFEYAKALRESGDKKAALAELQKVSKALDEAPPAAPSMFGGNPNDALRFQIAGEFETLERKDLAAAERKKVSPQGGPGGMGMPGGGMMMPGGGAGAIDPHAGHNH